MEWWITLATFLQEVEVLPLEFGLALRSFWPIEHGGSHASSVPDPAPFRTVSLFTRLLGILPLCTQPPCKKHGLDH